MNKYYQTLTNQRGDVLPGYRVQVVTTAGSVVDIFADANETPFTDAGGGVVKYATADLNGRVEFYWTPATGHILQVLDANGTLASPPVTDFADSYLLGNLAGELPQAQVSGLVDDLAAKATTAALAAPDGAEKVGYGDRLVSDKLAERVSILDTPGVDPTGVTSSTAGLKAAIEAADVAGQTLVWPRGTYRLASTLTATVSRIDWICEGAELVFDPSSDESYAVDITCGTGADHKIVGEGLRLDAQGKAHRGMRFNQPLGDQSATFTAHRLSAENVEMQVGVAMGSAGLVVGGGWGEVTLIEPKVKEIMMRTGAGTVGVNGVTGILVINGHGVAGAYAKVTVIDRPTVEGVYSEDPAYAYDMDGIGVFANPAIDASLGVSTAKIIKPKISKCWGRDVKMQVGWGLVDDPTSVRDEGPSGGIVNSAYDFQTGPGMLVGGNYTISTDCGPSGSLCRFSTSTPAGKMVSQWLGGSIRVTGGADVKCLMMHDRDTGPERGLSIARGQTVLGTIREFAWLRTNAFDLDLCKVEDVTVQELTGSLFRVEASSGGSSPYRGVTEARNVNHLDTPVGLVLANISGNVAQAIASQSGCSGFLTDARGYVSTTNTAMSAGNIVGVEYPEPLVAGTLSNFFATGSRRMFSAYLDAGEQLTLPEHGYNGAYTARLIMGVNAETQAEVSVGSGLVSRWSGSGVAIDPSSDPGTGDLRIWRSGNSLVVKNGTANARVIMVELFG